MKVPSGVLDGPLPYQHNFDGLTQSSSGRPATTFISPLSTARTFTNSAVVSFGSGQFASSGIGRAGERPRTAKIPTRTEDFALPMPYLSGIQLAKTARRAVISL
jgi:hypothetical protein